MELIQVFGAAVTHLTNQMSWFFEGFSESPFEYIRYVDLVREYQFDCDLELSRWVHEHKHGHHHKKMESIGS